MYLYNIFIIPSFADIHQWKWLLLVPGGNWRHRALEAAVFVCLLLHTGLVCSPSLSNTVREIEHFL